MRPLRAILRHIRIRPRLTIATAIGILLWLLLPWCLPGSTRTSIAGSTRTLIAWDVGAGLYLALAWTMMLRADVERMRARAQEQDDGALVILALTVAGSLASLAAILWELIGLASYLPREHALHLWLAGITIICSWCIVHTAFALHYAHEFYGDEQRTSSACLQFPGNDEPDYVDFLYFAFVLGTTSQTSDVTIASSPMRRIVLVHGVVAFFFNTTLLALTVNIAAGIL